MLELGVMEIGFVFEDSGHFGKPGICRPRLLVLKCLNS